MDAENFNSGCDSEVLGSHLYTDEQFDAKEEARHFVEIYNALSFYGKHALMKLQKHQLDLSRIPVEHAEILNSVAKLSEKFQSVKEGILQNHIFLRKVLEFSQGFFNEFIIEELKNSHGRIPSEMNMDKVSSTIRQISRDWSEEGKIERTQSYGRIISALTERYPDHSIRKSIKILNPGAGLGRLAWELANLGFSSQGNEFSYLMLMVSNYILNSNSEIFRIYPHVLQFSNVVRTSDQVRSIAIPDIPPSGLGEDADFSMVAGDFLEVYGSEESSWDVVVTSFFVDTAKNVVEFIETFARIIKPGGYWVNIGPLLYHYSDSEGEISIELSYEELREVILHYGFEFEEEQTGVPCMYTSNSKSMLETRYNAVYFVCRRKN